MTQKFCKEYSRTKVKKLNQLLAVLREQTWKQKQHTQTKKDMKRTGTNWSDNSNHSLWLIRRKKLQIVVALGELFLFVAYWTMIPIFSPRSRFFCWSDPDFSYQLSGRSAIVGGQSCNLTRPFPFLGERISHSILHLSSSFPYFFFFLLCMALVP